MNTQDKPLPTGSASEETIKENIQEMTYPPAEDIMQKDKKINAELQELDENATA